MTIPGSAQHVTTAKFKELVEADRALIRRAMREDTAFEREWSRENAARFLDEVKASGMQVEEHPDRESFRERASALKDPRLFESRGARELLETLEAAAREHETR